MNEKMIEKVVNNHDSGYNCAQAVACAYSDELGIDEKVLFQLASGLGVGMGSMKGSCGAVTAAAMVAGMMAQKKGLGNREALKLSKQITTEFETKNKSLICKTLKGRETGEVLRDCRGCVIDSAEMLESIMEDLR